MPKSHRTNEERSRETRAALLETARRLFEDRGYAATSIDAIATAAGVTRGALYHHFPTKHALFEAVVDDIQRELFEHVDRSARKEEHAWDSFIAGWTSSLDVAPEPGFRRILMLEGPAVLGRRWREIDDHYFLAGISAAIENLITRGDIAPQPVEPLARTLLAINNALMTLIVEADDPDATRQHVSDIWATLLSALRAR
jgi:AcrR family transcriptional regulator